MLWKSSDRLSQIQQASQVGMNRHTLGVDSFVVYSKHLNDTLSLRRVLILHLKRYSYNSQLSLNSKLGQQVLIPKYLTLLSHCTDATRPPLSLGWSAQTAM